MNGKELLKGEERRKGDELNQIYKRMALFVQMNEIEKTHESKNSGNESEKIEEELRKERKKVVKKER